MSVFTTRELPQRGTLARLFKRLPKENAFIEIENLLAASDPQRISDHQVDEILAGYKCERSDYAQPFADLYSKAVASCAEDANFSDVEKLFLQSLRRVLKIEEHTGVEIHLSIVVPI